MKFVGMSVYVGKNLAWLMALIELSLLRMPWVHQTGDFIFFYVLTFCTVITLLIAQFWLCFHNVLRNTNYLYISILHLTDALICCHDRRTNFL
jgi:hypothetical protein